MKREAATIVTPDYIDRALLLTQSLNDHGNVEMHVLVVGEPTDLSRLNAQHYGKVRFYNLDDIATDAAKAKISKYGLTGDRLRWSMKPDFLMHLQQNEGCDKILCLDCDLYFVGNYDFLYYDLEQKSFLLTPHWRTIDPFVCENEFSFHITHGIFNAGFVGVSRKAKKVLLWWSKVCEYKCEIDTQNGYYVDQRYLDLVPIYFPKETKIVRHQGCNVAIWNTITCRRREHKGEILLNEKWPLVFIHFSVDSIKHLKGCDAGLVRYYEAYERELQEIRRRLGKV